MGMRRSTLRRHVFSMLFRVEFHDAAELPQQDELYCQTLETAQEQDILYLRERVKAVVDKLPLLDARLEEISAGWSLERIGKVELTILRLALYEILYDEQIPNAVAVNEAVELAKTFGGDSSYSFVNGVLSKVL